MDIQIEIGTEEQREQIRRELQILERAAEGADLAERISRVVIPADFDGTVRQLTGDHLFAQNRGYHLVLAKVINEPAGTAILISPIAFTESFDTEIRMHYYLHELTHVGQDVFCVHGEPNTTERIYSSNLNGLLREYEAERHSLEMCRRLVTTPSELYVEHHRIVCAAFAEVLVDLEIRDSLRQAIGRFRLRGTDIEGLQTEISPIFDRVSKSLTSYAAYMDSGIDFLASPPLDSMDVFVTDEARELVRYFASKYEEGGRELAGGQELIRRFIETFGIRYEDTDAGMYCHVDGVAF